MAAQLMDMKGPFGHDLLCMAWANSSLPVPLSPASRMFSFDFAKRAARLFARDICRLFPRMSSNVTVATSPALPREAPIEDRGFASLSETM